LVLNFAEAVGAKLSGIGSTWRAQPLGKAPSWRWHSTAANSPGSWGKSRDRRLTLRN